jgi:4-hydroxythreonine-4-phosphate dehydrogenase
MSSSPLAVTVGDPAGIGPELVVRHFSAGPHPGAKIILVGPPGILEKTAAGLGIEPFWTRPVNQAALEAAGPGVHLFCPPMLQAAEADPGKPSRNTGFVAVECLAGACWLLQEGLARGLVTAPVSKAHICETGIDFPGHTEFLARAFGVADDDICMHLAGPRLRVSLVTTHPPLARVPGLVTASRIVTCLRLTRDLLTRLGLSGPMGVCGLNPHAGESGRIGDEEEKVLAPALAQARAEGLGVAGPVAADSLFYRAFHGEFDAVLAMYHDQGLGPLKLVHFFEAVNVTLGLPFVRTSPAHGTGFDLAGRGTADVSGLAAAVDTALSLCA